MKLYSNYSSSKEKKSALSVAEFKNTQLTFLLPRGSDVWIYFSGDLCRKSSTGSDITKWPGMERLAPMLKLLGDQESAKLLQTTLEEERQTDQKLVEISEIHN
jgi:hypothetical protein